MENKAFKCPQSVVPRSLLPQCSAYLSSFAATKRAQILCVSSPELASVCRTTPDTFEVVKRMVGQAKRMRYKFLWCGSAPVVIGVAGSSREGTCSNDRHYQCRVQLITNHASRGIRPYGRGYGVGRGLGVTRGVDVGVAVAVAVAVGVAVGVGVGVPPGTAKAYTLLSAAT
jgi:hypothetical protein